MTPPQDIPTEEIDRHAGQVVIIARRQHGVELDICNRNRVAPANPTSSEDRWVTGFALTQPAGCLKRPMTELAVGAAKKICIP
jgi:hypothetical protein